LIHFTVYYGCAERNLPAFHHLLVSSVAIGNPERHVHKASHRGSKQQ